MKIKKVIISSCAIMALGLLTACSSNKAPASISVKSGNYILEDGKTYDAKKGYLSLDVKVKNTSEKSISNIWNNNFTLTDSKGKKIQADSTVLAPDNSGFESMKNQKKLAAHKSMDAHLVFHVDKSEKYQLNFKTNTFDKNAKVVKTKLNPEKYQDPAKDLTNIASNYINATYLGKKVDGSQLSNKLDEDHKAFEQQFKDNFVKALNKEYSASPEEVETVFNAIEKTNASKGKVEYTIDSMFPNYAVVYVKPTVVDLNSLNPSDVMTQWEKDNQGVFDDYNAAVAAAGKYLLSQLPGLIEKSNLKVPDDMVEDQGYKLIMTKDDSGKWTVDTKSSDQNYDIDNLRYAFMGGEFN